MKPFLHILGLFTAFTLVSCHEPATIEAPPNPTHETRVFVESLVQALGEDLMDKAEAEATGQEMKRLLDAEAQRSWGARLNGGIKYADLFQKIYGDRSYRKAFAYSHGLKPRGEAVMRVLLESEAHALNPAPYHTERIQELASRLRAQEAKPAPDLSLNGAEAESVIKWLDTESLEPNDQTYSTLINRLVGVDGKTSPAPRLTALLADYRDDFSKSAKEAAELELRIADGALRYARDMKHFNIARLTWKDLSDAGGSKVLIYQRLEATFLVLAQSKEADQILRDLEPKHPQYALLIDSLARYRKVLAEGGWPNVGSVSLVLGTKGPRVNTLRKRLEMEGYLSPTTTIDNTSVDAALVEAFKAFEVAHQFRPSERPDAAVWRSLNVPVERRIEQIETSIQRWRESRYEGETDFVFVNIPDFHAEVYSNGVRDLRFRVVVGNTSKTCDPKTQKWVMPNATPIQMAQMDHLIINPFWSVPERIVEEELRPKFKNDPDWLAKNNYEVVTVKGGNSWIRQKPGDTNALGRVKFIFPNRHNTYMHDTPNKKYFDYPVRAFSHGCVRVKDPMNFAHYLLTKEELATPQEVDELLENMTQRKFNLKAPLPVFFEYYVVRVNDEGHTEFLSDIYKLDQARASKGDLAANSCVQQTRTPSHSAEDGDTSEPTDVTGDLGP